MASSLLNILLFLQKVHYIQPHCVETKAHHVISNPSAIFA